jgi:hypothetical protein
MLAQNLFHKTKRFNHLPQVTKGCSKLMHKRDILSNENTNNNNSLQVKNTNNNNNKKPKHNANNYHSTHSHPSSSSLSLPQVLLLLLSCLLTKVQPMCQVKSGNK